jgi:Bacterial Ig domain
MRRFGSDRVTSASRATGATGGWSHACAEAANRSLCCDPGGLRRRLREGIATLHRRIAALAVALAIGLAAVGSVRAVATKATDDAYAVNEDQDLTVNAAEGVLSNDMGDGTLCVTDDSIPSHGSINGGVHGDGSFTYTPNADFNGTDTFTYHMDAYTTGNCPVTSTNTATVTITIDPVNDAPTISAKNDCADGSVTVSENSGAYPSSQACVHFDSAGPSNESSQSLDSWVIQVASGTVGFSAGPTFTKSGNDGFLQFTPAAGQTGDATVSVQAKDSGGTAIGGVDLSNAIDIHIHVIDDAPVANADSFIVLKNTTLNVQAPGVLHNDSDPNGDPLTASKVTNPSHGVVTLASDGSFSYTPANGFEGLDAFSYKASDGQLTSATKVVSLHVTAVPPVATPTPIPTPTPTPTATPETTPSEAPTATAQESPTPFPTPNLPTAAPGQTVAAAAPTATAAPGSTPASGGGPSLPVILVMVLLVLLLGFGAAVLVPRWIRSQTGRPGVG